MTKIKTLLLLLSLTMSLFVSAQEQQTKTSDPKNILKINPFKLGLGTINLSYERMITDYGSLNLRLRTSFWPPLGNTLDGTEFGPASWEGRLNNIPSFNSILLDLEYRFYSKKKTGPQGFYAAPYLRYNHYNMRLDGQYTGMLCGTYRNEAQSSIKLNPNMAGIGVQLGAQWLIKNRVTIDWSFFGIGVDLLTIKGNLESSDLRSDYPQMQQDANEFLAENRPFRNGSVTNDGVKLNGKTRVIIPGIKTGFTIGYAF